MHLASANRGEQLKQQTEGRRYSHGERGYKKHVVDYSPLVIRPNFYDPLFIHYRLLNGLSAGHVRGYRHARATSLYTIIVCSFPPTVIKL